MDHLANALWNGLLLDACRLHASCQLPSSFSLRAGAGVVRAPVGDELRGERTDERDSGPVAGRHPDLLVRGGGPGSPGASTPIIGLGERTVLDITDDSLVVDGEPPSDAIVGLELDPVLDDDPTTVAIVGVEGGRILTEPGLLALGEVGARARAVLRLASLVAAEIGRAHV